MDEYGAFADIPLTLSKGRRASQGYARGWGLQFGDLKQKIRTDPVYVKAMEAAAYRTIQSEDNRMNIFLLMRFYLKSLPEGDIIEFGSYRGGSAIFMAVVARELGMKSHVWGLDTFEGTPESDPSIDLHRKGDFADVDHDELIDFVGSLGLDNLTFIEGRFEETTEPVLARARPPALVHIDCDVRSSTAYCYDAVKDRMADGGYIVFDDALYASCLGTTEVVEDLVIRRDGMNCEQIYPHFVFRRWR